MDPTHMYVIEDSVIPTDLVSEPELDPRDSFDEPGRSLPLALAPDLDVDVREWDDSFLLDEPDDDEERDDEMTLALLIEFGVDFDCLDEPDEFPPGRFGVLSDLITTEEADDEMAA